jgi:exosortase A-associated hydrolase 1
MAETTATTAAAAEEVLGFECDGCSLWGIVSRPPAGVAQAATAVVIAVGGPQYRVGSHRQFVLLARRLAAAGYPVLRFDYRGMGDSEGDLRNFEGAGPDLRAAIDAMWGACPGVRQVVVWGLCDAASAALMFATEDARVAGIVAANPWARSEATLAVAQVKHYYGARLLQREFWAKLLRGGIDWRDSLRSLLGSLKGARRHYLKSSPADHASFQTRMARGLARFRGRVLLVLSGNDLTAKEFLQYAASDATWKGLLDKPGIHRVDLPESDHTFSTRGWLQRVEEETLAWLKTLGTRQQTQ